ncbi:MAG: tRNA (adenosine(37)-N6)-threonylcarbamoyltransferase complex dimerization subunit type 1 TsaB [Bacillota bacterium]
MNMLAVDTSGAVAGLAVFREGRLVYETYLDHKMTHSQALMPMIEQGLEYAKMPLQEIAIFACTVGPGSFTGVRIGVSTVKALAYAFGKSVLGVNTLDTLAYNVVTHKGYICAVMDARCDQVYTALYVSDGKKLSSVLSYQALSVKECMEAWPENCEILMVGDGAQAYREEWERKSGATVAFAPDHLIRQRASAAGACALAMLAEGIQAADPFALEPFYLRLPQAEREYRRRVKEQLG